MAVLIYGDTLTSAALRHEVAVAIGDPFLYLETDGRRAVLTNSLEDGRLARAAPELERLLEDQLGRDELLAAGARGGELDGELCARAVAMLGIREATVPPDFPLGLADRLRGAGIALTPDEALFHERRRHKTPAELEGIRRAVTAAMAAMREAASILGSAAIDGADLRLDGELLTAEALRARMREVCTRAGAPAPPDIMVKAMGPGGEGGHEPGAGPLPAHVPIEIDLWPQDERSGCWADMTRTYVRGEIGDALARQYALVLEAHERSCAAARAGVTGVEVYGVACDVFEAAGHPTARTKKPGETLRTGFYFGLGHGVGLEVHEAPNIGRSGAEELIAGDVIALEPGVVDPVVGGTRVEDLLIVGEHGAERLTDAVGYDLTP